MTITDKYGNLIQRKAGRSYGAEEILVKIRYSTLARLFNCRKSTVMRWKKQGKLDPYSLEDIIDKYNNREKLDYRRKK